MTYQTAERGALGRLVAVVAASVLGALAVVAGMAGEWDIVFVDVSIVAFLMWVLLGR